MVVLFILGNSWGCSRSVFYAASLAPEFRVPPTENTQRIDLSRLAMPSEASSIIGPGDVLEISIATGYEQRGPENIIARVGEDGQASIPLVGEIELAGLEPDEAERKITSVSIERAVYQRPHVTVLMKRKFQNKITVVGAVENPGIVQLDRSNSDLLGALAKAGGLTEEAGAELRIQRKNKLAGLASADAKAGNQPTSSQRINLSEIGQADLGDLRLHDGDVVMVFEEEPRVVHVLGLVREPKQIRIQQNQDLRVLDAIAMSGGRTSSLADKVHVIRHVPGEPQPIVIQVSVGEAKSNGMANLILAPDDVVSVEETPVTFVLGALKNMLRLGVTGSTALF